MKVLITSLSVLASLVAVDACVSSLHAEKFSGLQWIAGLRNATAGYSKGAVGPGPYRLVRFSEGTAPIPITENELEALLKSHQRFMDVTDQDLEAERASSLRAIAAVTYPSTATHQAAVTATVKLLSQANLVTYVQELGAFNNRYYKSTTGATASNTLYTRLANIAASAPGTGGAVTVKKFSHSWGQNSLIARIEGSSTNKAVVIAGAHLDSINQNSPSTGRAPGMDDDASGCANIIEAFRALVVSGFKPATPVEFHFYSGEEAGLLGSQAIAKSYSTAGTSVKAMLQLDMTAWVQSGTSYTIGFVTDRTNAALNVFTKMLVSTYVKDVTIKDDYCGYGCSDHASWDTLGYPATYPFEAITETENPNMHVPADTDQHAEFSYAHMHHFSQLLVAYYIELAS
jgi:leucyl aminopeptidase